MDLKQRVRDHWESEVCGSRYGSSADARLYFEEIDRSRYEQDHMIPEFAAFQSANGKRVLEVGLGTGADFVRWVRAGADASGRDLTDASVSMVSDRLSIDGLEADVARGDAENLDFAPGTFDIYYSWGVLHHTPDTAAAIREAHRVLKPGGVAKIMLYHWPSVGSVLGWLIFGPLRGDFRSPRAVLADHVESPGTKWYTAGEARQLMAPFRVVTVNMYLGSGDLFTQAPSEAFRRPLWRVLRALYPRWLVRLLGGRVGTVMTIEAVK